VDLVVGPTVVVAVIGCGYKVWRELPRRRMEQLNYLERRRRSSRPRADDEHNRRRSGGWR
jgi:hypothetical protein